MENFNNPRTEGPREAIKVSFIAGARDLAELISREEGIVEVNQNPDIYITNNQLSRSSVQLQAGDQIVTIEQDSIGYTLLSSFLKRVGEIKKTRRLSRQVQIKKNLLPLKKFPELSSLHNKKKDLSSLDTKSSDITSFLKNVLELDVFKNYKTCILLTHEKGTKSAWHHRNSFDQLQSTIFPLDEFKNLFKYVQNSRSKAVTSFSNRLSTLNSIGFFVGINGTTPSHNYVLLFSRNDFLEPGEDEQNALKFYFQFFPDLLKKILSRQLSNSLNKVLKNFIESSPLKIIARSGDEQIKLSVTEQKMKDTVLSEIQIDKHIIQYESGADLSIVPSTFHSQRVEVVGELINTLNHELSNPLFGSQLASQLMLAGEGLDPEFKENVTGILTNIERCQKIVSNFSKLYHGPAEFSTSTIKKIVSETLMLVKSEFRDKSFELVYLPDKEIEQLVLNTNITSLTQILFNLLINACQALEGISDCKKSIILVIKQDQDGIEFQLHDNGPGIKPTDQQVIFNPFFTTKKKGTGLGLSICNELLKEFSGELLYENSQRLGGACFIARLKGLF